MVLENAGALRDLDSGGWEFESLRGAPFRRNDRSGEPKHSRATDMKKIILALAILYPTAVLAQGTSTPGAPPTVGGKPLVVVGQKKSAEGKKEAAKPLSP